MSEEFYTFYDYMKQSNLTASEEDYLEMICRLTKKSEEDTRINDLAKALNIKAPSVTHMMKKLNEKKLIDYERYGRIKLTPKGEKISEFLLYRHEVVFKFLTIIGVKESVLDETEKLEHMISQETLKCLEEITVFFDSNLDSYQKYQNNKKRQ